MGRNHGWGHGLWSHTFKLYDLSCLSSSHILREALGIELHDAAAEELGKTSPR